jgi:hypothetical protein
LTLVLELANPESHHQVTQTLKNESLASIAASTLQPSVQGQSGTGQAVQGTGAAGMSMFGNSFFKK